jgi:anhydro-N-acetylmuramic acid kinase
MSGTSLDGVDGVLVDFSQAQPESLGHHSLPLSASLQADLLALNTPGDNELHRAALSANALVRTYAAVVDGLLVQSNVSASAVRAIGAHGQTVRHRPQEFDGTGYTLQLNQPALLAELTGIDVVADFRSRDVAAGGQGAPLVPPFHQAFFGHPSESRAVLNIGGISNITLLESEGSAPLRGYDCGPGNALLDAWCKAHTGAAYDDAGQWAAQGTVNGPLLERFLNEPFFAKSPPKSTGRDLFNLPWLYGQLAGLTMAPVDVQATLTELTAQTCAQCVRNDAPSARTLIVCGGGAFNEDLMRRLQDALPTAQVTRSSEYGLPPWQVEATAFAWIARQTVNRKTGSLESVTGARGARILGAIYPA